MSFLEKVKESLATKAAEGIAASLTVLLVWAAYQVAPAILPAIEAVISKQVLLGLLVSSLALNIICFLIIWSNSKKEPLRLKYGIYWDKDKNPHCPACKTPISAYGDYQFQGKGYSCKPCKKIFALKDATGKDVDPSKAMSEL